ncbi:SMI1/KNR4 family protein [Clostridium sp. AN503]|uniref:SMI1/KNR4 family protein n=1 Tax=Clostridium sp. AN503 TaxID=3160598 RepID=UPI00345807F7
MSYKNFKEAMSLAPKCNFYTTVGGKTEDQILRSEKLLGVKFSRQCKEFYKECGYMSFFGSEIYGIDPDDNSGILEGNSVAYALNDRKECDLCREWIPIYNIGDGDMVFLDYANKNSEGEPRVIECFYNGSQYEFVKILAEDFGSFVLQLVQTQLSSQQN